MPPVRPVAVVSTTIARTVHHFYAELMAELGAAGYEVHVVVTSPGPEVSELRTRADEVHLIPMQRGISPWPFLVRRDCWLALMIRPDSLTPCWPSSRTLNFGGQWVQPRESEYCATFSHVMSHEPS